MEEADRGAEAAEHRRLHAGPTLLRRHGTVGLRERAAREPARQRHNEPALSRLCAYQRRGVQHARVPARLQLPSRSADGARSSLQGLVDPRPHCRTSAASQSSRSRREGSNSMNLTIRKADIEDAAAIAHVHVESWKTTDPDSVADVFLASLNKEVRT